MTIYKLINTAPTATSKAPATVLRVKCSPKKSTASTKTNTTLKRSSAATPDAGPFCNAKK